jgi:putative redox protein
MRNERFEFTGEQGAHLVGKLDLPDAPAHSHALFAHCFTCTKDSLAAVRIGRALAGLGIGVLRFDFTGLGQSGGEFADSTFSGSVEDVLAAVRAMRDAGSDPALLIGHSLGGAAVLAAAAELPNVKAVATIGAPFDVEHVARLFGDDLQTLLSQGEAEVKLGGRPFKVRRSFVDDLRSHDQGQRIAKLRRALLVLHAPGDRTVDIDNAAQIFQAARHPKSFVSLDDADHLLTRPEDAAYAADVISAWAARYVGKPQSHEHADRRMQ